MFEYSFFACTFFFFFFEMEFSLRALIPLLQPGSVHTCRVSWDDCGQMFPDNLRVSLLPDRFPQYATSYKTKKNLLCIFHIKESFTNVVHQTLKWYSVNLSWHNTCTSTRLIIENSLKEFSKQSTTSAFQIYDLMFVNYTLCKIYSWVCSRTSLAVTDW